MYERKLSSHDQSLIPDKDQPKRYVRNTPRMVINQKPLTEITSFTKKFEFLSNEYNCVVKYDDYIFQSSASLFYAFKAVDKGSFMKFQRLSPIKARAKAQKLVNDDWEENKEFYLEKALRAKFDSNPDLKAQLLKTGKATLLNNVTHLDDWIGIRNDKGYNALGKALMKLREEYKEENNV